ncbi:MAG: GTP-binding protein [Promethearchaeia archaeon]
MKKEPRILNIIVAGHAQHGKSSLIEKIVGTFPDNLDYELMHGTTVSLKVIQFHFDDKNLLINFLDSPGHADFKGGIALGLEFADLLLLVISGKEGFQARTYWLYDIAHEKDIPIVIAATKMDLNNADTKKIQDVLTQLGEKKYSIIETSAKEEFGIKELLDKLAIYVPERKNVNAELEFIVLGFSQRKGIGDLVNIGILSGTIQSNKYITEKIRIRQIFSLEGKALQTASEGSIVQISMNISPDFSLGSKFYKGKILSPKIESLLTEINPRKEFHLKIEDPVKFRIAEETLENLKKTVPSFDYFVEKDTINVLVLGDVQFDFIKENLEQLIEFKILDSKVKGIITIDKMSKGRYKSARVKVIPRFRKKMSVTRNGKKATELYDIIGASAAYDAFHLDAIHIDILSGKNEDDIAQAIAKAIEKTKLVKIFPHQDIIIKVENYHEIYGLIEKYNADILYQSQSNTFFLQVKNHHFENFFNSLMKISDGQAEINLFKFDQSEKILSVDPGTRHIGFCILEKGELPSLWYVNLKRSLNEDRAHSAAKAKLTKELDMFLENDQELITQIFIGHGPGSEFMIEFLIEYFGISCEDNICISSDPKDISTENDFEELSGKTDFGAPDIYLVDEFKTTKEALYHLQQGKLVNEVKSKGFVDHAIASLLIAKRGIKGETIEIKKKPLRQLQDYVIENYSGTHSFKTIHNIDDLIDIEPGMYLRVNDSSKLDSNLNNGDIIQFKGFGKAFQSFQAINFVGNKIIVKFQGDVKVKREFFDVFSPVRERF